MKNNDKKKDGCVRKESNTKGCNVFAIIGAFVLHIVMKYLLKPIGSFFRKRVQHMCQLYDRSSYAGKKGITSPDKHAMNVDYYISELRRVVLNENVYNVALSAPFGAGKSSVIRKFIDKNPGFRTVTISTADFRGVVGDNNGNVNQGQHDGKKPQSKEGGLKINLGVGQEAEASFDNEIRLEERILKQLFYRFKYSKLPGSRYRKPHRIGLLRVFVFLTVLAIMIAVGLDLFGNGCFSNKVQDALKMLMMYKGAGLSKTLAFFALGCLAIVLLFFFSYILRWILARIQGIELNIANKASIKRSESGIEDSFNKNIDEIVYLFEEIPIDIVFIEDLDRFEDKNIFIKLREINTIINQSNVIRHKVTFVYALKDDLFTPVDRAKFFDATVSIVPYINSRNSASVMLEDFRNYYGDGNQVQVSEFVKGLLKLVAPLILDRRLQIAIVSEFYTMKTMMMKSSELSNLLEDDKTLGMIIFKILYPNEYEKEYRGNGDSIFSRVMSRKKEFVIEEMGEESKTLAELSSILSLNNVGYFNSASEVKKAFVFSLVNNRGMLVSISCDSGNYDYSQIMDDSFDLTKLSGILDISIRIGDSRYGGSINHDKYSVDEHRINGLTYPEHYLYATNHDKQYREQKKEEYQKLEHKKMMLSTMSLKELIIQYGVDKVLGNVFSDLQPSSSEDEYVVLKKLLSHGYIDESYGFYISGFHMGYLSDEDNRFLLNLDCGAGVLEDNLDYPVQNSIEIIELMDVSDFEKEGALNTHIAEVLFSDCNRYEEKLRHFIMQFTDIGSESAKRFVRRFFEITHGKNVFHIKVSKQYKGMWFDFITNNDRSGEVVKEFFVYLLSKADMMDIKRMDNYAESKCKGMGILSYVMADEDRFITLINVLQTEKNDDENIPLEFLQTFRPSFKKLELEKIPSETKGISEIKSYIFKNNLYELNRHMISVYISFAAKDASGFDMSPYSYVKNCLMDEVLPFVGLYPEEFVRETMLKSDHQLQDEPNDLIELYESLNYDDLCHDIMKIEESIFDNLSEWLPRISKYDDNISKNAKELLDEYLDNQKVQPKWENVLEYVKYYDVSDVIKRFIEENVDKLVAEKETMTEAQDALSSDDVILLIKSGLSENCLRTILSHNKYEDITRDLSQYSEDLIRIMIDLKYFSLTDNLMNELWETHRSLFHVFIDAYAEEISNSIDEETGQLSFSEEVVDHIFENCQCINNKTKEKLLAMIPVSRITDTMMMHIRSVKCDLPNEYIIRTGESIDDENELVSYLIRYIDYYSNEELEDIFGSLNSDLKNLSISGKPPVMIAYNKLNARLVKALKKKEYIVDYQNVNPTNIPKSKTTHIRVQFTEG